MNVGCNRLKLLRIDVEAIANIFSGQEKLLRIESEIPGSAVLERFYFDERQRQIALVFRDESFDMLGSGAIIPSVLCPVINHVDYFESLIISNAVAIHR